MRIGSSYADRERRYFVQSQRWYPINRGVGEFKKLPVTESSNYRDSVKGLFNPSLQYLLAPLLCANLKKIDMT